MNNKQVYNPFLPLDVYIPDGEPHVFGNRVYLYGSHDKEGGYTFCMLDYEVFSAPADDLTAWRSEGISYRASQDPAYPDRQYMYAPDVVKGNDNRYYLYYCMSGDYGVGGYTEPISVAVGDSPAGPFEYLGHVQNKDGSLMKKYICFDPAVMNDEGTIRLYYGTWYGFEENEDFFSNEELIRTECNMFGKSREEILEFAKKDSVMGAVMATLEDDMLTIKEEAHHIIPYGVKGTAFENHPFFEASSMRKINGKYYFIYSSMQNHELCYAVSDKPDCDFVFGGTIVSNADICFEGREEKDKLNMTGTTHGSVERIGDDWYVFYHRLTHKSDYSRQACAERINIEKDGSIKQVQITSCGLNNGPLKAEGKYPAVIACNITNGNMPHGCNCILRTSFPNVTNDDEDRFIGEISEGTLIGYKYFEFGKETKIGVCARTETEQNLVKSNAPERRDERSEDSLKKTNGSIRRPGIKSKEPMLEIRLEETGDSIGEIKLDAQNDSWSTYSVNVGRIEGTHPLYFVYHGEQNIQIKDIEFTTVNR